VTVTVDLSAVPALSRPRQLQVETQQGHRGSKPVEIAAGIANVRDRLELDAPGGVTVTVDLSAVPALSRPRQLQVELQPWDAGRFGARNKKDVGDRRLAWFCLDLDAGTDFDLEGVQPGVPCKLSVRDERLTGELEFTVGPAQQTSATLRVRPQ
jgi:hypothetical protein